MLPYDEEVVHSAKQKLYIQSERRVSRSIKHQISDY